MKEVKDDAWNFGQWREYDRSASRQARAHEEAILPFTGGWYSPPPPFHRIRRRATFVIKTTS
jgi:hypothetical protein